MRAFISALVLLGFTVFFIPNVTAQAGDNPAGGLVHAENPDADATFAGAQPTNCAPTSDCVVTGLTDGADPDAYQFDLLPNNQGGLVCQYVQGDFGPPRPAAMSLFQRVGDVINYATFSPGDSRPVVCSLVGAGEQLISVVSSTNSLVSSDSTSVVVNGNSTSIIDYKLVTQFRPQISYQSNWQLNQRDASQVTAIYNCNADASVWYYRDLDLSVAGEADEAYLAVSQLPQNCWAQGFNFTSTHPMTIAVVDMVTGERYLVRKLDHNDPWLPDAPGVDYSANAPAIMPGELTNLIPSGRQVVIFYGIMAFSNGSIEMSSSSPTTVREARSAHPTRASLAMVENIHPAHAWTDNSFVLSEVTGQDLVNISLSVASAAQVSGYHVRATRNQPGRFGQPAGSVVFADTVYVLQHFNSPTGYQLSTTHQVNDLQAGETVSISVNPLGRGLYYDTDQVGQGLTQNYQFVVGTPGEDAPDGLELSAQVIPNPIQSGRGQGTLRLTVPTAGNLTFTVYDSMGRQVMSGSDTVVPGETSISFGLQGVASGVYALRVQQADQVATTRFTVVR